MVNSSEVVSRVDRDILLKTMKEFFSGKINSSDVQSTWDALSQNSQDQIVVFLARKWICDYCMRDFLTNICTIDPNDLTPDDVDALSRIEKFLKTNTPYKPEENRSIKIGSAIWLIIITVFYLIIIMLVNVNMAFKFIALIFVIVSLILGCHLSVLDDSYNSSKYWPFDSQETLNKYINNGDIK